MNVRANFRDMHFKKFSIQIDYAIINHYVLAFESMKVYLRGSVEALF